MIFALLMIRDTFICAVAIVLMGWLIGLAIDGIRTMDHQHHEHMISDFGGTENGDI